MSASIRSLGYVAFGAEDLDEWRRFGTQVLGMQLVENTETSVRFRMDEFGYRFQVDLGAPTGVHTIGWGVRGADELDELVQRLEQAGYQVERHGVGSERAVARSVRELATFVDPDGVQIELFHTFEQALTPFVSPLGHEFVSNNELGLGHVFQMVSDVEKYNELYRDLLGFTISDYIGPATFYHCNPRHHSFAFVPARTPELISVGHIMLETTDIDACGRSIDAMNAYGFKERATLGKHTNDKMISFYVETPSGTQIEFGTGGILIEDEDAWVPTTYGSAHYWGHEREH